MRAVPCLALLLAALLLQGTAADSKCDPSSTNCQGVPPETLAWGHAGPGGADQFGGLHLLGTPP
jgi:hypothetical protein